MCHIVFNIQEKSYVTVHISLFSHTGQAQMGPNCTPAIGPLLSHGQQCSIVFYKMVLNQRFDVMFNFQHKSDHTVHISHFSHTGQAPMGPSFSPAIGPLLPHGPARPSRPAWGPLSVVGWAVTDTDGDFSWHGARRIASDRERWRLQLTRSPQDRQ